MADQLRIYNLGTLGVNVDKSPLHLDDGELPSAQNAIRDVRGVDGGIRKRMGLKHFNPVTLAGRILGGIGLPLPLLVGTINGVTFAPNTPGTDDGDGVSTGVGGSGGGNGPGSGEGGGAVGVGGSGGGGGGTGANPTGVPIRIQFWMRTFSTTSSGYLPPAGWWLSVNGFTTAATEYNSAMPLISTRSFGDAGVGKSGFNPPVGVRAVMTGSPGAAVVINNKLYYSGNPGLVYTKFRQFDPAGLASAAPGVRVIVAETLTSIHDTVALTIPADTANDRSTAPPPPFWDSAGVLSMCTANGFLYFSTVEGNFTTGGMTGGRVWRFDPANGNLVQLGAPFIGIVPYSLCYHSARLWVGTANHLVLTDPGKIYWIGQETTGITLDWTLDKTQVLPSAAVACMVSFRGLLFAFPEAASSGTGALVLQRDALGVWTTSLSEVSAAAQVFAGGIVFKDNLYVANWRETGQILTIRKYDGTTWTTAFTAAGATAVPMVNSWVENDILFFGGGGAGFGTNLVSSPDGAVWTARLANLTNTSGMTPIAGRAMMGVLVA